MDSLKALTTILSQILNFIGKIPTKIPNSRPDINYLTCSLNTWPFYDMVDGIF